MKNYSVSEFTHEALDNVTSEFIADLTESFLNKKVTNRAFGIFTSYGPGTITGINGTTLTNLMFTITFDSGIIKEYSAKVACFQTKALTFVDEADYQLFDDYCEAYKDIEIAEAEVTNIDVIAKQEAYKATRQAEKDAEAIKKAEKSYEARKQKAYQDFEEMSEKVKSFITPAENFYYALGWLAKKAINVSATLPDYLSSAFEKYFGPEAPKNVIDSSKRTSGGFSYQWSWGFKASFKKTEDIPEALLEYVAPTNNAVTNTSFIWSLVENYGFKFGKKQDVELIKSNIPTNYISVFEEGYAA